MNTLRHILGPLQSWRWQLLLWHFNHTSTHFVMFPICNNNNQYGFPNRDQTVFNPGLWIACIDLEVGGGWGGWMIGQWLANSLHTPQEKKQVNRQNESALSLLCYNTRKSTLCRQMSACRTQGTQLLGRAFIPSRSSEDYGMVFHIIMSGQLSQLIHSNQHSKHICLTCE